MVKRYLPLAIFGLLVVFLAIGLTLNARLIPSPYIGKQAPAFEVPRLAQPERMISKADLKGQVSLLNVWATWCVSCRQEHDVLMRLAESDQVAIYGLNYKDERDKALRWLDRFGNPYTANAFDQEGQVGIDWGVYGTPETFVIDSTGVIRYKHTGPLTYEVVANEILPLVQRLRGGRTG